jgi:hypothetical protein
VIREDARTNAGRPPAVLGTRCVDAGYFSSFTVGRMGLNQIPRQFGHTPR